MQTKLLVLSPGSEFSEEIERLARECSLAPGDLCRLALETMLPKVRSGEWIIQGGKLRPAANPSPASPRHA